MVKQFVTVLSPWPLDILCCEKKTPKVQILLTWSGNNNNPIGESRGFRYCCHGASPFARHNNIRHPLLADAAITSKMYGTWLLVRRSHGITTSLGAAMYPLKGWALGGFPSSSSPGLQYTTTTSLSQVFAADASWCETLGTVGQGMSKVTRYSQPRNTRPSSAGCCPLSV